jgi:hypothetical protein
MGARGVSNWALVVRGFGCYGADHHCSPSLQGFSASAIVPPGSVAAGGILTMNYASNATVTGRGDNPCALCGALT